MSIYKQVKEDIGKKINEGTYKSGDRIPAERVLADQYGISRMTLRQALNELEREGLLHREKGRGTFVSAPDLYQENLMSFTKTLINRHMTPSTRIIEVSKVLHLRHVSQMMGIHADEPYYKIKRVRCGDDIPIALETVYLPIMYAKDIDSHDLTESLYGILEQHYGYEMVRSGCEIEAVLANRIQSELLATRRNTALLKISGITYCQGEQMLFYEESYYRSDLYKYHVDIKA